MKTIIVVEGKLRAEEGTENRRIESRKRAENNRKTIDSAPAYVV